MATDKPSGDANKEVKNEPKVPPAVAKEKKSGNRLLLILLLLLALGSGGLGWLLFDQTKQTKVARAEVSRLDEIRMKLESDIKAKIAELEKMRQENGQLSSEHEALMAKYQETLDMMNKYKRDAANTYRAQARFNEANQLYSALKVKYDSLMLAHNKLTDDFTQTKTELTEKTVQNEQLTKDNTQLTVTVKKGQELTAYNVQGNGMQVKKSGKEKVQKKAKRVNKIEACFMLGKNAIAETGNKQVYLRIVGPDGIVLAQGTESNQFEIAGEQMMFTAVKDISYNGNAEDICMSFSGPDGTPFKEGTYRIEIYADGIRIGESSMSLAK